MLRVRGQRKKEKSGTQPMPNRHKLNPGVPSSIENPSNRDKFRSPKKYLCGNRATVRSKLHNCRQLEARKLRSAAREQIWHLPNDVVDWNHCANCRLRYTGGDAMAWRSQRSIQIAAFCLVLLPSGPDRSNVTAQVRTSSDTLFSRSVPIVSTPS